MIEKKIFTGGMNKDTEDRFVPKNDWRDALNIRVLTTNDGNFGAVENVIGNTPGEGSSTIYPIGNSTVIGAYEDKLNKRVFYFLYNSNGAHHIKMYDGKTSITKILAISANFNFNIDYKITGVCLIDTKYLIWTDDLNEPSLLNIEDAINDSLPSNYTRQCIDLMPYAPTVAPITRYKDSVVTETGVNNLKGKLYQFKYRYVYKDGRKSSYSPISKVCLPTEEFLVTSFTNYKNFFIELEILNTDNQICDYIEVAVRDSNISDFYNFKKIQSEDYNSFTTITFNFSNSEVQSAINLIDSNALFSWVPIKAKALDFIANNRIVLANLVEGFDNISTGASYASPVYTDKLPEGYTGVLNNAVLDPFEIFSFQYSTVPFSSPTDPTVLLKYNYLRRPSAVSGYERYTITIKDVDNNSNVVVIVNAIVGDTPETLHQRMLIGIADQINKTFISGPAVYFGQNADLDDIILLSGNVVLSDSYTLDTNIVCEYNQIALRNDRYLFQSVVTTSQDTTVSVPLKSFKSGAKHRFGFIYSDEKGRISTVQTSPELESTVNWYSERTASYQGVVNFQINIKHQPPIWAKKYQIVYAKNDLIVDDPEGRGFIQYKLGERTEIEAFKRYRYKLEYIVNFNEKYSTSTVDYDYTNGDRLRVLKINGGTNVSGTYYDYLIAKWFPTDKEIEIEFEVDPLNPGGSFRLEQNDLVEIYSPKNQIVNQEYYEIGEIYDILNPGTANRYHAAPQNQTATQDGIIRIIDGDVYLKNRVFIIDDLGSTDNDIVEDYHFSDYYDSNDISIGRVNLVDNDAKQYRQKSKVRWSNFYIPDSNINGLGTFYDTSFAEYDKDYGGIQKLYAVDKKLTVFQETKTGQILVQEQILNDQAGTQLVTKSDNVLSDIQYYAGEFGIGLYPESHAAYGFAQYFVDPNRAVVARISNDGITKISDYYMHTFFNKRLPAYANNTGNRRTIIGTYDEQFNEYVLSFSSYFDDGLVQGFTVAFNESANKWSTFYSFLPEWSCTLGNSFVTFLSGRIYLHNKGRVCNFYGLQYNATITLPFNDYPSNNKFYNAISVESNDKWTCEISNQNGQQSSLIKEDFDVIENVNWAAFLRDQNSPGGLMEGDTLRSPELTVKLTNKSLSNVKLFSVGVKYQASELTNK